MDPFHCIIAKLEAAGIDFEQFVHEPVTTSAQAAALRNTSQREGAKALVLHKDKSSYILAVLAADRQADFPVLRLALGAKKVTMASPEEVLRETGCEVGGVPPFGSCLGLPTYVDPSLSENERIAFNAGRRTHSISMNYEDWVRVERPINIPFARPRPV
jgi:Ala-tRNA(Pro) deacylase